MLFKLIGFGVCAIIAVAVMQWAGGVFNGTKTPQDLPYEVNNQFGEVGFTVEPREVPERSAEDGYNSRLR